MLNKVTLVVPTYNRPGFVHRMLSYYSGAEGLEIAIGDGSAPEILDENRQTIASFSNSGLNILHYTPEMPDFVKAGLEAPWGFAERVTNAGRMSNRPYVFVIADDDFVSPGFLGEAAAFLDANADYSAVTGYIASFSLDQSGPRGKITHISFPSPRDTAQTAPHAADRIGRYEHEVGVVLDFAFFRRDVFERISAALLELGTKVQDSADTTDPRVGGFTSLYLFDFIFDHIALAMGKVHWLPKLQLARHFHEDNWAKQVREEFRANLGDAFIAPHWPTLAKIFLDAMTNALIASEGLDPKKARRIAEGGLALRCGLRLSYVGRERLGEAGADRSEMRHIPDGVRKRLRRVPGMLKLVRTLRGGFVRTQETSLEQFPDVVELVRFIEKYSL